MERNNANCQKKSLDLILVNLKHVVKEGTTKTIDIQTIRTAVKVVFYGDLMPFDQVEKVEALRRSIIACANMIFDEAGYDGDGRRR